VRSVPVRACWSGPVPPGSRRSPGREIVVTGAHGGAGTTTVAVLLQSAWDMGVVRRPARGGPPVRTGGRPVVLVTGNTAAAAARATAAVNTLARHGCRIAVLAVVSDGLPEPAVAAYRFRVLAARVGTVVRVPFIASLRAADDPAQADLPRSARRSIADIVAAALAPAGAPPLATTAWEVGGHAPAGAHPGRT